MRHLAIVLLGAVSTVGATPAAAVATPSPVQIDNCRLEYTPGGDGIMMLAKTSGRLKIKFTNESEKRASVIRFAVNLDGKEASIRDVGTFAPGVTVDHGFKDFAGNVGFVFGRQAQPKCHVTYVKFADGTAWQLPDQPHDAAASPAPSPAPSTTAATSAAAPEPSATP